MANDEDPGAGGGHNPPISFQGSCPQRFQNLSLIDSSYLLLATELDKDVVQSTWLPSLAESANSANHVL